MKTFWYDGWWLVPKAIHQEPFVLTSLVTDSQWVISCHQELLMQREPICVLAWIFLMKLWSLSPTSYSWVSRVGLYQWKPWIHLSSSQFIVIWRMEAMKPHRDEGRATPKSQTYVSQRIAGTDWRCLACSRRSCDVRVTMWTAWAASISSGLSRLRGLVQTLDLFSEWLERNHAGDYR